MTPRIHISPTRVHDRLPVVAGILGGAGFTGVITLGLALVSAQPAAPDEPEATAIVSVALPDPPPPPPLQPQVPGTPLPPAPIVLQDDTPSASDVQLPPSPLAISAVVGEVRPTFFLHFDFAPGAFAPDTGGVETDVDHVFHPREVDQRVVAIYRKVPKIPSNVLDRVKDPRVRALLVVNADGTVQDVRLLLGSEPEFDRLILEALREWRFRPAVKRGKKVRCLAELPVRVRASSADPFSTD